MAHAEDEAQLARREQCLRARERAVRVPAPPRAAALREQADRLAVVALALGAVLERAEGEQPLLDLVRVRLG